MKFPLLARALLPLLLAGCGRDPLEVVPCPCSPGYVCDPSSQACVAAPAGSPDGGPGSAADGAHQAEASPLPPLPPPDARPPARDPCAALGIGIATVEDFESKFIAPRCGMSKCHGPSGVFPPRNLHMPWMIRSTLVGKKSVLNCKNDFYIDKSDPGRSYVLAKIWAVGDTLACPTNTTGKADSGGTRMPNKTGMPTIVGNRLTDSELECFTWWVHTVANR